MLLLCLLVFAGGSYGGYYLHTRIFPAVPKEVPLPEFTMSISKQHIFPQYFDNLPKKKFKTSIQKSKSYPQKKASSVHTEVIIPNFSIETQDADLALPANLYTFRTEIRSEERIYTSNSTRTLPVSGFYAVRNSKNSTLGSYSGTTSFPILPSNGTGTPLLVPFSGGTPGHSSTHTILFDPGAATNEEIENNIIPVGDGWLLMLVAAGVFSLIKKYKNVG